MDGLVAELMEQGAKERGPGDPNAPRGLDPPEAAADERRVVPGEDLPELFAVRFGPEGGEDLVEQGGSFPRTPILRLLRSCCSSAADRYLSMHGARIAAVFRPFDDSLRAAARPRTRQERNHEKRQRRQDLDRAGGFKFLNRGDDITFPEGEFSKERRFVQEHEATAVGSLVKVRKDPRGHPLAALVDSSSCRRAT